MLSWIWFFYSCLPVIFLIFWLYTILMGWMVYADNCERLSRYEAFSFSIACLFWLIVIFAFSPPFSPKIGVVVCLFNRKNPVVMWVVQAVHGGLLLPSGCGARLPPSPAPVIPPHPLRPRARGSAGKFPPTTPGQLLALVSVMSISQ